MRDEKSLSGEGRLAVPLRGTGTNEYLNFLNIAAGSASEARYLVELSWRLGFLREEESEAVTVRYTELAAGLVALIQSLSPEP